MSVKGNEEWKLVKNVLGPYAVGLMASIFKFFKVYFRLEIALLFYSNNSLVCTFTNSLTSTSAVNTTSIASALTHQLVMPPPFTASQLPPGYMQQLYQNAAASFTANGKRRDLFIKYLIVL